MITRLQLESSKLHLPVPSNPFNAVIHHYHATSSSCTVFLKLVLELSLCSVVAKTAPQSYLAEALNFQKWGHRTCGQYRKAFQGAVHLILPQWGKLLLAHVNNTDFKRKMLTETGEESLRLAFLFSFPVLHSMNETAVTLVSSSWPM